MKALQYYGGGFEHEAPAIVESDRPDAEWPSNGLISFRDVVLRYTRYGVAVLKRVNFVVPPREKIGIVGRTGSGKSTLLIALLRIVENCGGKIFIDGVDLALIGLHDLRKSIAVIPQEPVLFKGTVRSNLDPFAITDDITDVSDVAMWRALGVVRKMNGGLDMLIDAGGTNLSLGQRQLFCIARVILS